MITKEDQQWLRGQAQKISRAESSIAYIRWEIGHKINQLWGYMDPDQYPWQRMTHRT